MNVKRMVDEGLSLEKMEAELRRCAAWEALRREENHAGRAASRLGIHRNTFTRLLVETKIPAKPIRRKIFVEVARSAALHAAGGTA